MRNLIDIITEDISEEITLYHGGSSAFKYDYREMIPSKKGKWEFGAGLYLTNSWETAKKYGKGSRTVYAVTLSKGKNITDISVDKDIVLDFLSRCVAKANIENNYLPYLENQDGIDLTRLNNLCVNNNFPSSKTIKLRNFFIEHGADYAIERGFGDYVIVVFNPNIITKVEKATTTNTVDVSKIL